MQSTALWLVILLGLQIAISIPSATTSAILHGLQRYDLVNVTAIIETLITATATVLVLTYGGSVLGLAIVGIPSMLVTQAARIWIIYRIAPDLQFGSLGINRQMVRTIMSFGMSLFVTNMVWYIETKTDKLVIGAALPISAVTPYTIAQRLSEIARMLAEQFVKVLLPLASELDAGNERMHLRALYIVSTRLTLAIFLPIGCAILILARSILTAWVGSYAEYANLVIILTAASLIDISQWPAGSVLQGMARHLPLAAMAVCSALANVALSIMLVRGFGLTGIALGTLIPMTIVNLGFILPYALRVIGVSATDALKNIFLPPLLPAIPTAIVLYGLQDAIRPSSLLSIMVVAGVGFLVYVAGYLTIGANKLERKTCRSIAMGAVHFVEARLKQL
jgi:O-antigen/teichoic acid export membrane protein